VDRITQQAEGLPHLRRGEAGLQPAKLITDPDSDSDFDLDSKAKGLIQLSPGQRPGFGWIVLPSRLKACLTCDEVKQAFSLQN
jgi:hypothetical protein